jgi:two-component system cell cycle response regulator DivK
MACILIVEDNPANMKLALFLLQSAGHTVLSATNAEAGLSLARSERPDLVLMDIQLPGMNGIEALRVLRGDPVTDRIPVIAVTASVMQQDRKLITEAGFDAYVGKPITLAEFLKAVNDLLGRAAP